MRSPVRLSVAAAGAVLLLAAAARAQDNTASVTASNFTLKLTDSNDKVLTTDQLATYFSRARCACGATTVKATLSIDSEAAAKLGTDTVSAQLMIGNGCSSADVGCPTAGGPLTLSAAAPSASVDLSTSAVFAAASDSDCQATSTTSIRIWAIIYVGNSDQQLTQSLALAVGGAGPSAPTEVKAVSADEGLLVSWTASGDRSTLQGHQVLCSPGPTTPSEASYDTCGSSAPDGGTGPFDTLDPKFICSGLIGIGTTSARLHGLENGRTYQIAVVAVGLDGTPSAPSSTAEGTPAPTVGFGDLYGESGGTATGCTVGGRGFRSGALIAGLVGAALLAWRRRRRASLLGALIIVGVGVAPRPASANTDGITLSGVRASPRMWNVELRFGPYRPDVDSEFADRGQSARPYEEVFSSSRHLMMQLEIDRQLLHKGGTWALGLGIGYFNVTAAALSENLQERSGDQTGLRLIPLSAVAVYRADILRERWGSPIVPYVKAGLDCTLWRISDTSQASISGRTFGWHGAAGVTIDLSPLDPDAAGEMDRETGVNQTAVFFEVARYSLDGFGSGSALHVGDTTWFAGLMLEL